MMYKNKIILSVTFSSYFNAKQANELAPRFEAWHTNVYALLTLVSILSRLVTMWETVFPSPKPTFCPKRVASVNAGLGEG